MIEIGGKPILWHIMKYYSYFGHNDFVICCGYKGYQIKEYFFNYAYHSSDILIDLVDKSITTINNATEPWRIKLIDTGEMTQTGGRLKKISSYLESDSFMLTYGDGLCNVNINKLIEFHFNSNCLATVSAVQPPGRFGSLDIEFEKVTSFKEKPVGDGSYINGGFFVVSPSALHYLTSDNQSWEADVLPKIAKAGGLGAFKHDGFWQSMDTLRDRNLLEELWRQPNPPWKTWD
jgi:glucose-1-phosphate cytidylyltransferase